MAAPTYTTDLSDILLDMPSTTGWSALGGGQAALTAPETDYYIQGNNCITKGAWASATKGMIYSTGATQSNPTDGALIMWLTHLTPNSLAAKSAGGIQVIVGSSSSAYDHWYVGGSDTLPFGGWVLAAVDLGITPDNTTGAPNDTSFVGALANLPTGGPTKGSPFAIDAFRIGRGEFRCVDGDLANGYATFASAQSFGDDITRRWGLLSFNAGAYYQSGLFVFGTASTAVDFRDANRVIFIRDHDRVTANFNGLEVRNSGSNVALTNISVKALGTNSPGRWITTDNATVALTGCTFTDMGTFSFLSGLTAQETTWRGCGQITAAGSEISDCTIAEPTVAADSSSLVWDVATDPDGKLDGTVFTKGSAAHHAIEFGTSSPTSMTLRGNSFSGFNAANAQNDSTFYFKRTTGTVTLNLVGVTGNVSYKTDGAAISIVQNPVTTTITVKTTTGTAISGARVLIEAADGTGPLPYQDSVTITRIGSTASVSHTSHGLSDGQKVVISGADQQEYNGVQTISNTSTNAYDFTVTGTPTTPATGTIISTAAVIEGLTDGSGVVSDTRTFTSAQPIVGVVRKGSSSPYYKTGTISGTISATTGFSTTVQLVRDE